MAEFARVTSINALRDFKAALIEFIEEANVALSEAQSDVQRSIWWVQQDRMAHWQREIKKRAEKVAQAKSELFKAQLASNDVRTSAVLERKALAQAQRRLEEAEEKLRRVKKWAHALDREFMLFKAQCQQVSGAVAGDLPNAVARLERMIDSLQKYVTLAAPSSGSESLSPNHADALSEISSDADSKSAANETGQIDDASDNQEQSP